MEDPRCQIAAIEMEDSRCTDIPNSGVIQVEDRRCESLQLERARGATGKLLIINAGDVRFAESHCLFGASENLAEPLPAALLDSVRMRPIGVVASADQAWASESGAAVVTSARATPR